MLEKQEYLDAIQARVCSKCVDGDGKGNCLISRNTECAVEKFFPQILEAVHSTHSTSMEPYEAALRNKVCGACIHQSSDGKCAMRDGVDCSLDRYFPMIVQVIEELELGKRPNNSGSDGK